MIQSLHTKLHLCLAVLILSGCGQKNSQNPSSIGNGLGDAPPISTPSTATETPVSATDLQRAVVPILNSFSVPVVWYDAQSAVPKNCVPGIVSGTKVNACQACAIFAIEAMHMTGGMYVFNISWVRQKLFVPFKKAISYDQPEVQPIGGGGVWIPIVSSVTSQSEASYVLNRSDLGVMGLDVVPWADGFTLRQSLSDVTIVQKSLGNASLKTIETHLGGGCGASVSS